MNDKIRGVPEFHGVQFAHVSQLRVFRTLTPDGRLLFVTRCARLFAYGLLAVVLVLYLSEVGLDDGRIGLLVNKAEIGLSVSARALRRAVARLPRP